MRVLRAADGRAFRGADGRLQDEGCSDCCGGGDPPNDCCFRTTFRPGGLYEFCSGGQVVCEYGNRYRSIFQGQCSFYAESGSLGPIYSGSGIMDVTTDWQGVRNPGCTAEVAARTGSWSASIEYFLEDPPLNFYSGGGSDDRLGSQGVRTANARKIAEVIDSLVVAVIPGGNSPYTFGVGGAFHGLSTSAFGPGECSGSVTIDDRTFTWNGSDSCGLVTATWEGVRHGSGGGSLHFTGSATLTRQTLIPCADSLGEPDGDGDCGCGCGGDCGG